MIAGDTGGIAQWSHHLYTLEGCRVCLGRCSTCGYRHNWRQPSSWTIANCVLTFVTAIWLYLGRRHVPCKALLLIISILKIQHILLIKLLTKYIHTQSNCQHCSDIGTCSACTWHCTALTICLQHLRYALSAERFKHMATRETVSMGYSPFEFINNLTYQLVSSVLGDVMTYLLRPLIKRDSRGEVIEITFTLLTLLFLSITSGDFLALLWNYQADISL